MTFTPVTFVTLGLSDYLRRYSLPGLMNAEGCELKSIAVRNVPKARTALGSVSVPLADSYDAVLARQDIEAVYIMLPNALHLQWVMRAIEAGKHVICEKPMALTVEDVETIRTAAESKRVHVMEGYMYRFHPQWTKVAEMLQDGGIGVVRSVIGHYAYLDTQLTDARFAVGSEGGTLRLVGCYAVGSARLAFGTEPRLALGRARYRSTTDIDLTYTGILEFETGHAAIHASVESFDTQYIRIVGESGMIEMGIPWNPAAAEEAIIKLTDTVGVHEIRVEPADQFKLEFEHFARVIRNIDQPVVPLSESAANTAAIEALRQSAFEGSRPVPVA